MADRMPIIVVEGNNVTVIVTITRKYPDDDLMLISEVQFILKDDDCLSDTGARVLSTLDASQAAVVSQVPEKMVVAVFLPPLTGTYQRFYRVDALTGASIRRTSVYGPVTVTDV